MIPLAFDYARAASLDDALTRMAATGGQGKFIAGGHSLVPLMKLRLTEPKVLIDISRIPELSGIRQADGAIEIGAATVHHDIASSAVLRTLCPAVCEAAAGIGDAQVRNRGTLGGSIAHADPSADLPAVMLAIAAEIRIQGTGGARVVAADRFFRDLFTVDLAPDELITSIRFAPAPASAYAKLHQRASRYAIVGVAAALDVEGQTIVSSRVGLTGACAAATRLSTVESLLSGRTAAPETIADATANAGAALTSVNADIHASADYRRAMVGVFARRALERALARA